MPNNATVNFNVGILPPAFNPGGDWQVVMNEFFKAVTAYLPGNYNLFNFGNGTPTADDQDKPWIRTNADGSPDKLYIYFNGLWVARHPIEESSSYRMIWVGTEAALWEYEATGATDPAVTVPTATTGAFWEVDTAFNDRIPMGILSGTGQVQTPLALAGALTQDITLLIENMPRHSHDIAQSDSISSGVALRTGDLYDAAAIGAYNVAGADLNYYPAGTPSSAKNGVTLETGQLVPDPITMIPVPPVIGVYLAKRTGRIFYTV